MRRAELQAPACSVGAVVYGQGERRRPDNLIRNGALRFFSSRKCSCPGREWHSSFCSPLELTILAILAGDFHECRFWNCHLRRNRTLRRRLAFVCSFGCNIDSGGAEMFFARLRFCRATCACVCGAMVEPNGSRLPIRRRILRYGLRGAGAQLGAPV